MSEKLETNAFDRVEKAIDHCDAVVLSTPTTTHFELGLEILESGKHLLVEKPITATVEEGQKLLNAATENDVKLAVGHLENFNPAFVSALEYIKTPIFVESHRLSPFVGRGTDVSVIMDLMIHDIEILIRLMGDVKEVHASGGSVLSDNIDIASARIQFETGVANVTASRISSNQLRKMRIFSKGKYISIDFGQKSSNLVMTPDGNSIPENAQKLPVGSAEFYQLELKSKPVDQLYAQLSDFVRSIREDSKPFVSGEQGLAALKVASKIHSDIFVK
jgi:predicted dehydrogenase